MCYHVLASRRLKTFICRFQSLSINREVHSCLLVVHIGMLYIVRSAFWTCDSVGAGPIESLQQLIVSSYQFFSKTALRIFLIFSMKVPYYKGKKRARRFFRKNSGSLIMRKNAFFALPRSFLKNVQNFWREMVS